MQAHLFDPEREQAPGLLDGPDAASVAERHEAFPGELFDQFVVRLARLPACADVKHHQLVDFLVAEDPDRIDRVTDVLRLREPGRLH